MGTCARHMQYFRALYATNAKKSGMAALRTAFTTFQPRPWQRDLLTILTGPVDPCKFYWYHDYIRDTGDKMYFTSGRSSTKGFAYLQYGPTEIWEDKASCILMSENPTNRERSRHVDVRVHFLRDMVRDGSVKLVKCADTQNVADALTKSLPRPAFHKHREFLKGTAQSFSAFFASIYEPAVPAYVTKRGSLSFSKGPPKCIGG
jgi:hypothetical protein